MALVVVALVVVVAKATVATVITATEILHMLVSIESLTKCVDMAAGYVSTEDISKLESRTQSE